MYAHLDNIPSTYLHNKTSGLLVLVYNLFNLFQKKYKKSILYMYYNVWYVATYIYVVLNMLYAYM